VAISSVPAAAATAATSEPEPEEPTEQEEDNKEPEQVSGGGGQSYNYWRDIVVSEFMPNPSGSDDGEWIELYNKSSQTVDLSGFGLQDNSTRVFIIEDLSLSSQKYLIIDKSDSKIALNNSGGDAVKLYDPDGELLELIEYKDTALEDRSYARKGNSFSWTTEPTPGADNVFIANQAPEAKIILESDGLFVGEKIKLSASGSSDPEESDLEYIWDFGDETTGDEVLENHVYDSGGSYKHPWRPATNKPWRSSRLFY